MREKRFVADVVITIGKSSKLCEILVSDVINPLFGADILGKFKLLPDVAHGVVRDSRGNIVLRGKRAVNENRCSFSNVLLTSSNKSTSFDDPAHLCTFRSERDIILQPNTHTKVRTSNGLDDLNLTVEVKGVPHLFYGRGVKPQSQVVYTDMGFVVLVNFGNRPVLVRRGEKVAEGLKINAIQNFVCHPNVREETNPFIECSDADRKPLIDNGLSFYVDKGDKDIFSPEDFLDQTLSYLTTNYNSIITDRCLNDEQFRIKRPPATFDPKHPLIKESFMLRELRLMRQALGNDEPLIVRPPKHINLEPKLSRNMFDESAYNVNENLSESQKRRMMDTLFKFRKLFAYSKYDLRDRDPFSGKLPAMEINTGDNPPVRTCYGRRSPKERKMIEELIKEMLDQGVIQESESPWASPVVIVTKKDGSPRFCVDYRKLNSMTVKESWPIPLISDALDSLAGSTFFTSLDLFSGYWLMPVSEAARPKTAFISHVGLYEYRVMPFGLTNAPSRFQFMMDTVLRKLKWKTCCVYLDDVIVFGKSYDEHLERLEQVMKVLEDVDLKLNPKKCFFGFEEISYLGHVIDKNGVRPQADKVEKIKNFPVPTTVKQLQSFLGLSNYYRTFIDKYSIIAAPLYRLLRKIEEWHWTQKEQHAFDQLREALCKEPVRAHFDENAKHFIYVDTSADGIGAILKQSGKHPTTGQPCLQVVSYWGRALQDVEKKFSATELELMGVVNALTEFRPYIHGRCPTIVTDHAALTSLKKGTFRPDKVHNRRLTTWQSKLAEFDFEIQHRPGRNHSDVDAISRMDQEVAEGKEPDDDMVFFLRMEQGCPTTVRRSNGIVSQQTDSFVPCGVCEDMRVLATTTIPDILEVNLKEEQEKDAYCKVRFNDLKRGNIRISKHFFIHGDNILYRRVKNKGEAFGVVVVPTSLRVKVMEEYHDSKVGGHLGINATLDNLRPHYWWPGMKKNVTRHINGCEYCQRTKVPRRVKLPLVPTVHTLPYERLVPFQVVAVDIINFDKESLGRVKNVLVAVDVLTKFVVTKAVRKQTSTAMVKFLFEDIINMSGCPEIIISDRGKQLTSKKFVDYCASMGIANRFTARFHPQANGIVERKNQEIKARLKTLVNCSHTDWSNHLSLATFIVNNTPSTSTGQSAFYLYHGYHPRHPFSNKIGIDHLFFQPDPDRIEPRAKESHLRPLWDDAWNRLLKAANKAALKNAGPKVFPEYEVGDEVWLTEFVGTPGAIQGFCDAFFGPFIVTQKLSKHRYECTNPDLPSDVRVCSVGELKKVMKRPMQVSFDFTKQNDARKKKSVRFAPPESNEVYEDLNESNESPTEENTDIEVNSPDDWNVTADESDLQPQGMVTRSKSRLANDAGKKGNDSREESV